MFKKYNNNGDFTFKVYTIFALCRKLKALIVLAISLGSLFLIAFIAALVIGPRMKEITVNQINKQLTVPVKVDDIDFSFIRMFPYASVELKGVSSDGVKLSNASHHLVKAESVFFLFNIWDVLGSDLKLKKLVCITPT